MYCLDDELAEFVQSGLATVLATASTDGSPHLLFAWAPRVDNGGRLMHVLVDKARAERTLENLRTNGRVAVTMGDPVSYRSVQFKGRFVADSPPTEADIVWLTAYKEAFQVNTALVGDPPAVIKNLWLDEFVRVTMAVERGFDQTPGPRAGTPL